MFLASGPHALCVAREYIQLSSFSSLDICLPKIMLNQGKLSRVKNCLISFLIGLSWSLLSNHCVLPFDKKKIKVAKGKTFVSLAWLQESAVE